MNVVQKRAALVLRRLADMAENDEESAAVLCIDLEPFLNELQGNDFFGTEAQCDPRGDFRNDYWSMERVDGVDA